MSAGGLDIAGRRLAAPPGRTLPEGDLKLGVRPEYVSLAAGEAAGALPALVTQAQDIGTHMMVTATLDGSTLKVRLAPEAASAARGRHGVVPGGRRAHLLLPERGAGGMNKPVNQKAWFLVLPVLICVAFSAILPLMTVVNYSVQDIISPERRVFVGTEWFASVMRDSELHAALCAAAHIFARGAGDRDSARHRARAVDAGHRLEGLCRAGGGGTVAADSVERGGHHLADLRPRRHRPARRRDQGARLRLQLHAATPCTPGSPCW